MGSARDPGPMARLAAVQADAGSPGVIFQRVCEGERLRDIWRAWGLPKGAATRWFMEEHAGLYDAALLRRVSERKLAAARGEVVAEQAVPDTLTLMESVQDAGELI